MINKAFTLLASTSLLLISQFCQADDFLNILNAEANAPASRSSIEKSDLKKSSLKKSKQQLSSAPSNNIRIMDKIAAKDNAYIPKNKNEIEYKTYLKDKYYKIYTQYIKLGLNEQTLVHEQYAESSFPRIEKTQEAIKKFLK